MLVVIVYCPSVCVCVQYKHWVLINSLPNEWSRTYDEQERRFQKVCRQVYYGTGSNSRIGGEHESQLIAFNDVTGANIPAKGQDR